jgi:catechol 2,3-dioxygenase-like lactoylglutathione lyase family enzyme
MLPVVDHVSIAVPDLERGIATFKALGFDVDTSDGRACAYVATEAIELVVAGHTAGVRYVAVACDHAPDQIADRPIPLRFVTRGRRGERSGDHPNGAQRLERVYVVVADLRPAVETYARVLDLPVPPVERGNVIKADMCVFDVGAVGIGIAQPAGPGPAGEALARSGPGVFQLLFRTRSLRSATRWMTDHGLPPPARGTRNTGGSAMLVGPEHACGIYMAFVGPE